MASKVLVKLPTVPFSQGKKSAPELVALPTKNEGTTPARAQQQQQQTTVNGTDRAAQLEQNMKYLQEQHHATLVALHQEVETLRQRNRDLQFQLVFAKSTNCVGSSPSSPEDSSNGFAKTKGSLSMVNVTPLQVELLEKDLNEMKASLNEVKEQNQHLLDIIDKQNKKLHQAEKRKEKAEVADVGIQVGDTCDAVTAELTSRLEDAEAMLKRLRRENDDHQRELAMIKAASMNTGNGRNGSGRSRGHDNGHHNRGGHANGAQSSHFHKFPPLQTQSYCHGGARANHSFDHNTEYHRSGRRRQQQQQQQQDEQQDRDGTADGTVLPQLRSSNGKPESSSYSPFYRSRGYHEDGVDYYRERGNRKYRGHRSQRDTNDTQDHRRDYKDGGKQDQQQRDANTNSSQSSRKQ